MLTAILALSSAFTVPTTVTRRAALHSAATVAFGLSRSPAHATAQEERMRSGLEARPVEPNDAELKLQERLIESVIKQEKMLGFKLEAEDMIELEKVLRNKYCGKSGLYGSMQGARAQSSNARQLYTAWLTLFTFFFFSRSFSRRRLMRGECHRRRLLRERSAILQQRRMRAAAQTEAGRQWPSADADARLDHGRAAEAAILACGSCCAYNVLSVHALSSLSYIRMSVSAS